MAQDDIRYEISNSVLANAAKIAALEVPGVAGLSTTLVDSFVEGMSGRLGKQKIRGVAVKNSDGHVTIDLFLIVYWGGSLQAVAEAVQQAVARIVQCMAGPVELQVNVSIEDVILKQ